MNDQPPRGNSATVSMVLILSSTDGTQRTTQEWEDLAVQVAAKIPHLPGVRVSLDYNESHHRDIDLSDDAEDEGEPIPGKPGYRLIDGKERYSSRWL